MAAADGPGDPTPKQYLPLAGRPLLAWTLDALLATAPRALVLVVAPDDARADAVAAPYGEVVTVLREGGAERAHSVLAGLAHLAPRAADDDLVLVHDAARPCITPALVEAVLAAAADGPDGALLATPVAETVKRDVDGAVAETLDRSALWLAQTPQVFPFARLHGALGDALAAGEAVTDEAAAVERTGGRPRLVPGTARNLKVTRPGDLELAAFWLAREGP
jgi:2-C-methyl-D-erythritol 4-phosphate cytidylyltransferase